MTLKEKYTALLKKAEARQAEIDKKIEASDDVKELKGLQVERNQVLDQVNDLRAMISGLESETADEEQNRQKDENEAEETRGQAKPPAGQPKGPLNPMGTYRGSAESDAETRAKLRKESEERGKALLEKRSVTVASSNIVLPAHQASDIRPTFNEVSSLIDRVRIKPLPGGESFKQPYVAGYGTGDYKAEGEAYASAEPTFGYAEITKAKVTAYAEDSEELVKLPAADYDGEVMKGIRIASRKKITREILVGDGATGHLVGIFSTAATAIDATKDISVAEIDETTLDEIIFSYGGDEEVEDAAVLILNKLDLKAFAQLRTADGKKIHDIKSNGNTGTIDGVPFIINSACKAVSADTTTTGQFSMAYGPLSNYMLTIFSDMDVQRSTDYKFKEGMIAHRGSVFVGGNVVSKNGFLRVKKG